MTADAIIYTRVSTSNIEKIDLILKIKRRYITALEINEAQFLFAQFRSKDFKP